MTKKERYNLSLVQALEISLNIWKHIHDETLTEKPDILEEIFELACPLCEKFNRGVRRCSGCPLKPEEFIKYGCCDEYREWAETSDPRQMIARISSELRKEKKRIKTN